jgi:DMSO/TMAO reductase YedYZ molybdopterin-dependent catalytic subunit
MQELHERGAQLAGGHIVSHHMRVAQMKTSDAAVAKAESALLATSPPHSSGGLVIRQSEPRNFEFPFDQLDSYLTPVESFYVRCHFHVPELQRDSYRLSVEGAVKSQLSITYDELRQLPAKTLVATLECAGNNRIFLVPMKPGAQWELGAVGNAQWTGVPLATLLNRAGLAGNAREVVLEGADRGEPAEKPAPPAPISYSRSLPLDKALDDVLIAYAMNGEDLPQDHGYPVRAIVPGHYGMASVKWLTHVRVLEEPFQGYWQTTDYGYWDEVDGLPVRRPLSDMKLKSQIARPRPLEVVPQGELYKVYGAAWSGTADVEAVDVTTDGGRTWAAATFLDPIRPNAWRRWSYDWKVPDRAGRPTLMSRARDAAGASQPDKFDEHYYSYVIHHTLPIEVVVE